MRKNRFEAPPSRSIRRPKENFGTYSLFRNRYSYSEVMLSSCSTIIFVKEALLCTRHVKRTENSLKPKRVALWVQNAKYVDNLWLWMWKRKRRQQRHTRE